MARPFFRRPRSEQKKRFSFYVTLKNIFLLLLILQFAPMIIGNLYYMVQEQVAPKTKVGYLRIGGTIVDSAFYNKRFKEFEKMDDIKALLIRIDSPGGAPAASQSIFRELQAFAEKKPVVVLVENVCASGAYYIACGAKKIIAQPSSLVGGVGVIMRLPNIKGLLNNWNVKVDFVKSGKYKATAQITKDMTPDEQAYLQALSDDTYKQFVNDVAQARNLDPAKVQDWADGKVFTGAQALNLNLIDEVGSFSDAEKEIKQLICLPADVDLKFVSIKKASPSLLRYIIGDEDYTSEGSEYSSAIATFLSNVYLKFTEQTANQDISINA